MLCNRLRNDSLRKKKTPSRENEKNKKGSLGNPLKACFFASTNEKKRMKTIIKKSYIFRFTVVCNLSNGNEHLIEIGMDS